MSSGNIADRMRKVWDAGNRMLAGEEVPELLEYFDPDIEWQEAATLFDRGTYRGHEGLGRLFAENLELWTELRIELEDVFDAGGDQVVSIGHWVGVLGGVAVRIRCVHVGTIRDGRIVKVIEYEDAGAASRAPAAGDP